MNVRHKAQRLSSSLLVIAAVVGMPAYAGGGMSGASEDVPQIKLTYADLNLSTQEGAAALYRRISRTAERVCSPRALNGDLRQHAAWTTCYKDAVSNAVTAVNHPSLTALHYRDRDAIGLPISAGAQAAKAK